MYETSKDLVSEKEEIKCNNKIKRYKKWLTWWWFSKENIQKPNLNWSQISNHAYRILIIGSSRSGKTNSLFNLINEEPVIDEIYLYAKDSYEANYQFLVNKRESTGLKAF